MADSVRITKNQYSTPPDGTLVGTDKIEGVDYQVNKLIYGDEGVLENFASSASPIPVRDFIVEAKLGNIPGVSLDFIIGRNPAAGTTFSTIWGAGNVIYQFPTTGIQPTVSSTSNNDTFGGSGANAILVIYLDSALNVQSEIVLMNGQAGTSMLATDFFRNQQTVVVVTGALGFNDGDIHVGDGVIVAGVPNITYGFITVTDGIGDNAGRQGVKTVPANKIWIVIEEIFSTTSNKFTQMSTLITIPGLPTILGPLLDSSGGINPVRFNYNSPLPSGADFISVVKTDSGTADTNIFIPYLEVDTDIYS